MPPPYHFEWRLTFDTTSATVEWTPAVISHPTTVFALRANWFGVAGEKIARSFGRISDSEVISGIPGSHTDHYGIPYSLTEEFAAVYEAAGFEQVDARLIERPTPLAHGIAEWVTTFRRGWLDGAGVPEAERAEIAAAVADRFGSDTADYVRLRFIMRKPA